MWPLLLLLAISPAASSAAADFPTGQVVADVKCIADPAEGYALYLPKGYTPDREWPIIFGFDPGGRGRNPVERYQAAAERYGFIVVGSNNSRNRSTETGRAVTAMANDATTRFRVDPRRVCTAGMSGGARVAVAVALASPNVAGVVASSAGAPDGRPQKSFSFPLFMTAGTEDFNHLEMRQMDAALTTAHRLEIFEGGHTWLSSALAMQAIEWMELLAMKTGLKPRDEKEIDEIFAARMAVAEAERTRAGQYARLEAIATDFAGLREVSAIASRAAALGRDKDVRDGLKRASDQDDREWRTLLEAMATEQRLTIDEERAGALADLRSLWKKLSDQAKKPQDSPDRQLARRLLSLIGSSTTTTDADYLTIIRQYRRGS